MYNMTDSWEELFAHTHTCTSVLVLGEGEKEKGWAPKWYLWLSQRHEFQMIFTLYNQEK